MSNIIHKILIHFMHEHVLCDLLGTVVLWRHIKDAVFSIYLSTVINRHNFNPKLHFLKFEIIWNLPRHHQVSYVHERVKWLMKKKKRKTHCWSGITRQNLTFLWQLRLYWLWSSRSKERSRCNMDKIERWLHHGFVLFCSSQVVSIIRDTYLLLIVVACCFKPKENYFLIAFAATELCIIIIFYKSTKFWQIHLKVQNS